MRKQIPTISAISLIRIPTDTVGSASIAGSSGTVGGVDGASPGALSAGSSSGTGETTGGGGELGCAESIGDEVTLRLCAHAGLDEDFRPGGNRCPFQNAPAIAPDGRRCRAGQWPLERHGHASSEAAHRPCLTEAKCSAVTRPRDVKRSARESARLARGGSFQRLTCGGSSDG